MCLAESETRPLKIMRRALRDSGLSGGYNEREIREALEGRHMEQRRQYRLNTWHSRHLQPEEIFIHTPVPWSTDRITFEPAPTESRFHESNEFDFT